MSKRQIRAAYVAERQRISPRKRGCLPLLVLFWTLHLLLSIGEFSARIWTWIKRRLLGWGLSSLLWPPVYERIKRSWLGLAILVKFGLGYFAEEPEKVDQVLDVVYVALNSRKHE